MILKKIESDLTASLKERNIDRVNVLRFILSKLHDLQIEKGKDEELSDEDATSELQREVKRHRESIEAYEKGGRVDLLNKEKSELEIIESYLPAQLSEEEVVKIIESSINEVGSDFGKVMSKTMAQVQGRSDGSKIAQLVKEKLT